MLKILKNKLYNGDCLQIMDELIAEKVVVDAVITDPPFGTTACLFDIVIPFEQMWKRINKLIKPEGAIVLFGSEPFSSLLRCSNLINYKYGWVWEKNNAGNFQLVNYQPLKIHENIMVFSSNCKASFVFSNIMKSNMKRLKLKQSDLSKLQLSKNGNITGWVTNKLNGSQIPTYEQWKKICKLFNIENNYEELKKQVNTHCYKPVGTKVVNLKLSNKNKGGNLGHLSSENKRESYNQNVANYPKSIIRFNRETGLHPSQKPIALMEFLIKTYTDKNETVLDFTMGSGTTGVACNNLKRKFIGIEKETKFFNIAVERLKTKQSELNI